MAIMAAAQLEEEPAARNSKRFPVKAKGEVRLRSVVSSKISGIRPIPSFSVVFSSGVIFSFPTWRTIISLLFYLFYRMHYGLWVNCWPMLLNMNLQ